MLGLSCSVTPVEQMRQIHHSSGTEMSKSEQSGKSISACQPDCQVKERWLAHCSTFKLYLTTQHSGADLADAGP